jgi:transposase-like protein
MRESRRNFTSAQKARIVVRHLSGKEPASSLADEFGIPPAKVQTWVQQLLDQAEGVFKPSAGRRIDRQRVKDSTIKHLKAQLGKKNDAIAELMEEHVKLKKELGEP